MIGRPAEAVIAFGHLAASNVQLPGTGVAAQPHPKAENDTVIYACVRDVLNPGKVFD